MCFDYIELSVLLQASTRPLFIFETESELQYYKSAHFAKVYRFGIIKSRVYRFLIPNIELA